MDLLLYLLMINVPEAPCQPEEDAPSEAVNDDADDEAHAEEPVPSPPGRGKG